MGWKETKVGRILQSTKETSLKEQTLEGWDYVTEGLVSVSRRCQLEGCRWQSDPKLLGGCRGR